MNRTRKIKHLVLWDGECGFCRRSTQWLQKHDRFSALEFQANQDADISPELRAACQESVHVIQSNGEILKAGRAILFCGRFTRWNRLARIGEWPIFLPFVELGYAFVARNRGLVSRWMFVDESSST